MNIAKHPEGLVAPYALSAIMALHKSDDTPYFKMRYAEGETGWAFWLPDGKAAICNVPMEEALSLYDIVEVEEHEDDWPTIKGIVHKFLPLYFAIRYDDDLPTQEDVLARFQLIYDVIEDAGGFCEGMVSGWIAVSAPEGFDPSEVMQKAGISTDVAWVFGTKEGEEEDDGEE